MNKKNIAISMAALHRPLPAGSPYGVPAPTAPAPDSSKSSVALPMAAPLVAALAIAAPRQAGAADWGDIAAELNREANLGSAK